jgi:hypothetical protein
LATFDLKGYARRGAEARITELNAELEAIYGAFPDLRTRSSASPRMAPRADGEESLALGAAQEAPRRRRRWKMTPAQKKAVGERMRKYWAARRKADGRRKGA